MRVFTNADMDSRRVNLMVIRHGQGCHNLKSLNSFNGPFRRIDPPLTSLGEAQATSALSAHGGLILSQTQWFCSAAIRTQDTGRFAVTEALMSRNVIAAAEELPVQLIIAPFTMERRGGLLGMFGSGGENTPLDSHGQVYCGAIPQSRMRHVHLTRPESWSPSHTACDPKRFVDWMWSFIGEHTTTVVVFAHSNWVKDLDVYMGLKSTIRLKHCAAHEYSIVKGIPGGTLLKHTAGPLIDQLKYADDLAQGGCMQVNDHRENCMKTCTSANGETWMSLVILIVLSAWFWRGIGF